MAGLELQRQLLKRLRRVVREWPSDPSRKGRDLGEFLKESYLAKFEKQSSVSGCGLSDNWAWLVCKLLIYGHMEVWLV